MADMKMTDCDFDKGAEAYKLIDYASIHYERGVDLFKLVTERRVRIKIFKEKGLSYANVKIPFYSRNNDEKILKVEAASYNLDAAGNIITTTADKKSVYTNQVNKNRSELIIAFPEVKAGTIIEYKYRLESDYFQYIDDWYFQDEIPTRLSQFELRAPKLFHFREDPFIYMNAEKKTDEEDEFITLGAGDNYKIPMLIKSYILRNVPGIHDEPYQPTKKDYMQHLSFQLSQINYGNGDIKDISNSWQDVQKRLNENEDFGDEFKKDIPNTEGIVSDAKNCTDSICRMVKVYNAVRNSMNWNNIEFIYSTQGIRTAWDKKTGNTADINIILIKLLQQVGINARPILFSTKDNGIINTFYPSEKQFNSVMAYVKIAGHNYILNAADKYNPYQLVPYEVANTNGFLMDDENGKWIVAGDPSQKYKQFVAVHAEIDSNGIMKGDAVVNSYDYAKSGRTKNWLEDKGGFKDHYFIKPYNNIVLTELEVNNAKADSFPLEQKLKFSMSLNSSGEYRYFNLNLFSGLNSNPFVADERQTDIDFNFRQEYTLYGNYTIAEGYKFDELPKNISMIMPDTSIVFSRFISAEDNALSVRINLEFKRSFYSAQNYDYFKEFYKKLFDRLNEQIVIKKI
ncbi:MAG: DUF3857 domain-containing protein [Ferruginibacter sp.]